MSHYCVCVLLPRRPESREDAEAMVGALMAPFDESISVEPYERPCRCIGRKATIAVSEKVDAAFGDMRSVRAKFWERPDVKEAERLHGFDSDELAATWAATIAPRKAMEAELFAAHPERMSPDPMCGKYGEAWWTDPGLISHRPAHVKLGDPYTDGGGCQGTGVVTTMPNGEWHERAEMGWFGMTSNDKRPDLWAEEWRAARDAHAASGGWVAAVDGHV